MSLPRLTALAASMSLAASVSFAQVGEVVVCNVWLADRGTGDATRLLLEEVVRPGMTAAAVDQAKAVVVADHAARLDTAVVRPFVQAATFAGFDVISAGPLLPWAAVAGSRAELAAFFASRKDVVAFEDDTPGGEELQYSVPSVRADWVRTHPTFPVNGSGVSVGVLDSGGVAQANPYLPAGIIFNGNPAVATHSTAVAGQVASSHPISTGVAPGVSMLSSAGGSGSRDTALRSRYGRNGVATCGSLRNTTDVMRNPSPPSRCRASSSCATVLP